MILKQMFWLVLSLIALYGPIPLRAEIMAENLAQDRFGEVAVYRPGTEPKGLLLLLSAAAGGNTDMTDKARTLAALNYLVVGIDLGRYLSTLDSAETPCADPAGDLQQLWRALADRYQLPAPQAPVLAGYGAGAALAYAALAQAPPQSFHAGISVDFCPRLPLHKPLCQGSALASAPAPEGGNLVLQPAQHLETSWFVFQEHPDCDQETANRFIQQVDSARLTATAPEDQAAGPPGWPKPVTALLQWLDPRISDQLPTGASLSGLPLVEVPAVAGASDKRLAVLVSGDGGWAALDRAVAAEFAGQGISTVGWDSLRYFWTARTPAQTGSDLERVLQHYLRTWDKEAALLIGYSFGADVLPFMVSRLSPDLRGRVRLVALLSPSPNASFEFHLTDWLGASVTAGTLLVAPEVQQLDWVKRLCLYGDEGDEDKTSVCPQLANTGVIVLPLPGDHHFNNDYAGVAKRILEQAGP